MTVALIVLAAGGSRRMGSPKQLAVLEGETLLARAARAAAAFPGRSIIVLGCNAERMRQETGSVETVINTEWESGMASSIHAGLHAVPEAAAVIIALADQPRISVRDLIALEERHRETGAPIVAAFYDGVAGVPALFDRSLFPDLLALRGDRGARSILRDRNVETIDMPHAAWDVDTPGDLRAPT